MTEQDALDILNYYNTVRLHNAIAYVRPPGYAGWTAS
jgi:hypothetical protein